MVWVLVMLLIKMVAAAAIARLFRNDSQIIHENIIVYFLYSTLSFSSYGKTFTKLLIWDNFVMLLL